MNKFIGIVCAVVLLIVGLTGCKAKEYEATIAGMEVEISELEVDKEQLEDKNDSLSKTVGELKARPTVTPTPEPTPVLEPLGKPLDLNIMDFWMGFVRAVCIYDEDERPVAMDDIAFIEMEDITIKKSVDVRITEYNYNYDGIEITATADDKGYVHTVLVQSHDFTLRSGDVDEDKLSLVVLLQAMALQSIYGINDGTDIFVDITEAFGEEGDSIRLERNDNVLIFNVDVVNGSVLLQVLGEEGHQDVT